MAGTGTSAAGTRPAQIVRFAAEVADRNGVALPDYEALRAWSVEHLPGSGPG